MNSLIERTLLQVQHGYFSDDELIKLYEAVKNKLVDKEVGL